MDFTFWIADQPSGNWRKGAFPVSSSLKESNDGSSKLSESLTNWSLFLSFLLRQQRLLDATFPSKVRAADFAMRQF